LSALIDLRAIRTIPNPSDIASAREAANRVRASGTLGTVIGSLSALVDISGRVS
jgi:hypothetical protein